MTRSPLVTGIAVVLGLLLFTVLVVVPRSDEVDAVGAQIATAKDDLAAIQADVAVLREAKDEGSVAADLRAVRAALPPTPELPELLRALRDAASGSDVGLSSILPGNPTPSSAGSASVIPLSMTVSGEYFSLARFLFLLETQARLTRVTAVSMSGDGTSGALSMQVTAEVYTTDLSAGPGSDPAPGTELGA